MVTVTDVAAQKLREIIIAEGKDPATTELRVFVQGGGCSGFQYGMLLDENPSNGDSHFESNGVKVVVDPISTQYLRDAVVDFVENDSGGAFAINNPNAKSTCGCGQSFST